jgi:hypothetical protein
MNTPIYDKRSKSSDLWKLGGAARKFPVSGQIGVAGLFDVWAFIPAETEEAPNTTNIGNFPTFPRRV